MIKFNTTLLAGAFCAGLFSFSNPVDATIVEFDTSLGKVQVNLYDQTTPLTVANFLHYIEDGDYTNSIIHRSAPGFVVQGGGMIFDGSVVSSVPTGAPVLNEPKLSNVRGTISMAKLPNAQNSATSQYFFNLVDNNSFLDNDNGGFAVFGEVIGDSMEVVNAIAALPIFNFSGVFTEVPLRNFTTEDFDAVIQPDGDNFVIVHSVTVIDTAVDTASALTPPANPNYVPPSGGSSTGTTLPTASSGGNFGILSLLMLAGAGLFRRLASK
jgi:peptidyl-prolyl cis-trans isomerase A (cyclophilin A)